MMRTRQSAGDAAGGVRVTAEVYGAQHTSLERGGMMQAPERGFERVHDVTAGNDLGFRSRENRSIQHSSEIKKLRVPRFTIIMDREGRPRLVERLAGWEPVY